MGGKLARFGVSWLMVCLLVLALGRLVMFAVSSKSSCPEGFIVQAGGIYTVGEIRTTSSGGKELTLLASQGKQMHPQGQQMHPQTQSQWQDQKLHGQYKLAAYLPELPAGVEWGGRYQLTSKKYSSVTDILENQPELEGFASYLTSKGICGTVSQLTWGEKIGETDQLGKFIYQLRGGLARPLEDNLPPETAALMQALILGEKNSLDKESKERFIQLGVMHVFVVSGFHFTLLSKLIWGLLGSTSLPFSRLSPATRRWIMFGFLLGYLFLLGPGNFSALRAFIVLSITILTLQFGYFLPAIQKVMIVLFTSVLVEPAVLQNIGFQMSFGAWSLLALISPAIQKTQARGDTVNSLDAVLAAEFRTAVWGTLLLAPLSLSIFGMWSGWSVVFGPLFAICLNYLQKFLYISAMGIWTGEFIGSGARLFTYLASPIESGLNWLKQLSLPDITILSDSNMVKALTGAYFIYLIYYLIRNHGPRSSEKVLARYSL